METKPAVRTCVLVLGMHRSGTSAIARMINLLGAGLPKSLMGADESNEAGHWEPRALVELNDSMLVEGGSAWNDWRPFDPPTALGAERFAHYRTEISRQIETDFADETLFVLKDPRISRFAPLYLQCLSDLNVEVKVVLVSRDALEVAGSLRKRDSMPQDHATRLWLRHDIDAEAATRGADRIVIAYKAALADPDAAIAALKNLIGATTAPDAVVDIAAARASLRGDLRHHTGAASANGAKPDLLGWAEQTEAAYLALSHDPVDAHAMATLDALRAQIDEDAKLNGEALAYALSDALRNRAELIDITRQRNLMIERSGQLETELQDMMRQRDIMSGRAGQLETELAHTTLQWNLLREKGSQRDAEFADLSSKHETSVERARHLEAELADMALQWNLLSEKGSRRDAEFADLARKHEVSVERGQQLEADLAEMTRQRDNVIERAGELEQDGHRRQDIEHDARADLADMIRQRDANLSRVEKLEVRVRSLESETVTSELRSNFAGLQAAFAERRRDHIIDLASTLHPDYGDRLPKILSPWRTLTLEKRKRIRRLREDYLTVLRSPLFDAEYYLNQYPDVANTGQDPILHYLRHGSDEGRWPSAAVDPVEARHFFPELENGGGNLVLRLIALLGPTTD